MTTRIDGQFALIIDTVNDAIRDTVRALGPKLVAQALWPAKKPEAAERYLDDCLNPTREQKLSIEEILLVARMGRAKGLHLITTFICRDIGYADPMPVDPDDQVAELQRVFLERSDELIALGHQIKRMHGRSRA